MSQRSEQPASWLWPTSAALVLSFLFFLVPVVSQLMAEPKSITRHSLTDPADYGNPLMQKFTTFDVSGAGKGSGQGTLAFNINEKRTIAGTYLDASNVYHGFVPFRSGSIKTFDVPGAGKGSGQGTKTAAFSGLTPSGAITGYYGDRNSAFHGYVRAPNGSFKRFNAPCAGKESGEGTFPVSITPAGAIAAICLDASNVNHGLLRAPRRHCDFQQRNQDQCANRSDHWLCAGKEAKKTFKSNVVFRVTK